MFWNWPLALVAIAVLAFVAERLATRATTITALVGIALCAVIVWPEVVEQSNLDAKGVNAVPALGVLVAIALSAYAAWRLEPPVRPRWQRWDGLRIATAVVVLLLGIPWLAADLGFSLDGVPLLGSIYQTSELRTEPGRVGAHPAVHAGHHHGMTGVLFVLSALLLSRLVPPVAKRWLRGVLAAYVAAHVRLRRGTLRERLLARADRQAVLDRPVDPERHQPDGERDLGNHRRGDAGALVRHGVATARPVRALRNEFTDHWEGRRDELRDAGPGLEG